MEKLTEAEWAVLQVLWEGESCSLGEVVSALEPTRHWRFCRKTKPSISLWGAAAVSEDEIITVPAAARLSSCSKRFAIAHPPYIQSYPTIIPHFPAKTRQETVNFS